MSYIYIYILVIYIYTRSYILLLIHTVYIILICIFVCGLTYLYIYCMYIYIISIVCIYIIYIIQRYVYAVYLCIYVYDYIHLFILIDTHIFMEALKTPSSGFIVDFKGFKRSVWFASRCWQPCRIRLGCETQCLNGRQFRRIPFLAVNSGRLLSLRTPMVMFQASLGRHFKIL